MELAGSVAFEDEPLLARSGVTASVCFSRAVFLPAGRYCAPPNAPVAQLDRASDFESEGREFESLRARHLRQHAATRASCAKRIAGGVGQAARSVLQDEPVLHLGSHVIRRKCRLSGFSSCCSNVAIGKPVPGAASFPLTVQAARALTTQSQPIAVYRCSTKSLESLFWSFVLPFLSPTRSMRFGSGARPPSNIRAANLPLPTAQANKSHRDQIPLDSPVSGESERCFIPTQNGCRFFLG